MSAQAQTNTDRMSSRKTPGASMSLGAHLLELRKRLFRIALGILVGAAVGFFLSDPVLTLLRGPILEIASSRNASLNYDSITGAFDLRIRIALYVGVLISCPIWLYQIFAFIMPALSLKEKRYTLGFFFSAIPLFLAGCAAGFFVFPHIVELLAGFASAEDSALIQASYYFDFVMKLVFAVGIAFVLPVFVVLLNFMGVISGTAILHGWRVAVLLITMFCAIATPAADVFSMFILAIPMTVLYFVAVTIAITRDRWLAKKTAALLTATSPEQLS